jgi:hypothetical protein
MGGLGNQLFQITTVIAYAIKYNVQFIFTYDDVLHIGRDRNTYWNHFLKGLETFTTKNSNITNDTINTRFLQYKEQTFHHIPIPFLGNVDVKLYGYYQSYLYFYDYYEEIIKMIDLRQQQKDIITKYEYYFIPDKLQISMHFRLGDYKTKPDYHQILPYSYYFQALSQIRSSTKDKFMRVLFFCENEDNEDVYRTIQKLEEQFPYSFEFVKIDDKISDWEQLLIMSNCDYNIIANSTFSWWGAMFNKKHNVPNFVYYPSIWFGKALDSYNTNDLFLPTWKKIELEI